jgi:hypothetical protein
VNVSCVEQSAIKAVGQHSCLGQWQKPLPIPSLTLIKPVAAGEDGRSLQIPDDNRLLGHTPRFIEGLPALVTVSGGGVLDMDQCHAQLAKVRSGAMF